MEEICRVIHLAGPPCISSFEGWMDISLRNEHPSGRVFFSPTGSPKIFIEGINIVVCDARRKIKMDRTAGGIAPRPSRALSANLTGNMQ